MLKKVVLVLISICILITSSPLVFATELHTNTKVNELVSLEKIPIIAHDSYKGNEGDSTVFNLGGDGLTQCDDGKTYKRYGNVGVDGNRYYNGFEVWIARWNYTSESSWASATFDLDGKYKTLTGKTNIINSYNTTHFDTTVYFYDGDELLSSCRLTNTDYSKDICIDVSGVEQLKLLVKDNIAVKGGTSFALFDMFLSGNNTSSVDSTVCPSKYFGMTLKSLKQLINKDYSFSPNGHGVFNFKFDSISPSFNFAISDYEAITEILNGNESPLDNVTVSSIEIRTDNEIKLMTNKSYTNLETYNSLKEKNIDVSLCEDGLYGTTCDITINNIKISYVWENSNSFGLDKVADYVILFPPTTNNGDLNADNSNNNGLIVYSDYNKQEIRKGSLITLSVGILADGVLMDDVTGITFQISDTSILDVVTTNTKNNCKYVKLRGVTEGKATIIFNDSNTGHTVKVPIVVYDNNLLSYTLNSVPTQNIEKYPTNIYNANGLYIDSYEYTINDDQSATVSFDVYNTNYIYGVVEVFAENGNMKHATLIEKMTSSNTSIKEALWDNVGYLVRDIFDGDLLSYRQESGYSKKTSVSVKIPKNGYIKITNDPEKSLLVGFVNSVDCLVSMASLSGDIKDFDVKSKEFSQKLTKKLLADQIYVELIKDGGDASKKLWKNVGKETFITSESMGSFTDTITKNIDELKLGSIIADTATDFGWGIGENVFTYFAGPAGTALNIMFTIGKAENLIIQQNDLIKSTGVGSIYIQNQGGGFRSCQQIKVESEEKFSSDISLNVFSVSLDSTLLNVIKDLNPKLHEAMTNGITHTYNISLLKNGNETQPNGKVSVYIPIPEDLKALTYTGQVIGNTTGKVKVYRIEEDGSMTEMATKIKDGCFVFTTEHFSLYTIVGYDFETIEHKSPNNHTISPMIIITVIVIIGIGILGVVVWKKGKKRF